MKGQSQIIQFILFFIIGLGLFLTIGNFFRTQLNIFGESVADANRKLIASYFSSLVISSFDTCKECDNVNMSVRLENVTANYIVQLDLNSEGLNVFTQPGGKNFLTAIHNIIYSLTDLQGTGSSTKTIILLFIKNQNKLRLI